MKRELLKGWMFMLAFGVAIGVSAQKVITNHASASGYPVIDVSELAPLGCVLTQAEAVARRGVINAQNPVADAWLGVGSGVSGENGTWNAKMSPQFQVMRADLNSTQPWVAAYTACKGYSGEGGTAGQWRLPTQRELMMIWVLHPQLLNKGSFTAFAASNYWSCTERNTSRAWSVDFYGGYTVTNYKTYNSRVRCVRDL